MAAGIDLSWPHQRCLTFHPPPANHRDSTRAQAFRVSIRSDRVANIRDLTDVQTRRRSENRFVRVVLQFRETDPPVGRVTAGGSAEFTGWLGLLRVLSELLASNDGHGDELRAGTDAQLAEHVGDVGVDGAS